MHAPLEIRFAMHSIQRHAFYEIILLHIYLHIAH
jgi:hypothetical protein